MRIRFAPNTWLCVHTVLCLVMVDTVCVRILNLHFGCVCVCVCVCVKCIVSAYSMILSKRELLEGVAVSSAALKLGCFHCCYHFAGNSQCHEQLKLNSVHCFRNKEWYKRLLTVSSMPLKRSRWGHFVSVYGIGWISEWKAERTFISPMADWLAIWQTGRVV